MAAGLCFRDTIICVMEHGSHHYAWQQVPPHHRTGKQILKRHRRLKKNARPVGTITLLFDKPRCRPKHVEPVPPEECQRLRRQLQLSGPDNADQWALYCLDRAGQLATCKLYDLADTEPITAFTEKEATRLLEHMVWDHSHEDDYITEATVEGAHQRRTWKSEISTPTMTTHLAGEPDFLPIRLAEQVAEGVRSALRQELPEYDFSHVEIYPSSSPQIFAPLRADKVTVVGTGALGKVKKYRMEQLGGKKRRAYYEAHSCAAYLNWIYYSRTQYNRQVFEQVLREAVARCPDKSATEAKPTTEKKSPRKKRTSPGAMGSIDSLKGRCASALVRFWSELDVPEDDTVGKYIIVTLRVLKYEGLRARNRRPDKEAEEGEHAV
jgi:hypothetical protein